MNIDNHFQTANIDHDNKEVQFEFMNRPIYRLFQNTFHINDSIKATPQSFISSKTRFTK